MAHPADSDLLRRVSAGERGAFLILFDRYYGAIERYAECLVQDTGAASSAASATFVRALADAGRRRPGPICYPATLFVTCRRLLLRGKMRESMPAYLTQPIQTDEIAFPDLDELPLSIILCRERNALIRNAMASLLLADREIIHLAFEPCLSRADVSVILKQPECAALTARLYHALQRLGMAVVQAGTVPPAVTTGDRGPRDRVTHWART